MASHPACEQEERTMNSTAEIRSGIGDWQFFDRPLEAVHAAAKEWKSMLRGVEKPWLVWHVQQPWTRLQVNLVKKLGWTPIVGYDPDCGDNNLPDIQDAIFINFNQSFGFKKMYMHFPLEFAFLWTSRIAFWHSDLLVRMPLLTSTARKFESIPDGEMAAVPLRGTGIRDYFRYSRHRMWELIGMTTAGASEDQFRTGTGWWKHFWYHPNCPSTAERARRAKCFYDHGSGIMYWHRRYGGVVHRLENRVFKEGHFSSFNTPGYQKLPRPEGRKMLGKQLELNFNLEVLAKGLGLEEYLT